MKVLAANYGKNRTEVKLVYWSDWELFNYEY